MFSFVIEIMPHNENRLKLGCIFFRFFVMASKFNQIICTLHIWKVLINDVIDLVCN